MATHTNFASLFVWLSRALYWACAMALAFGLAKQAKGADGSAQAGAPAPTIQAVRLGIINYLGEPLSPVFIDEGWAGNVGPRAYSSGTCCLSIPQHWQPGMTMKVEWRSDSMYLRGERALVRVDAPVLPYESFSDGYVWAVFLPGGEVFVQPWGGGPGLEGFLQGLPAPHEKPTEADFRAFIKRNQE